MSRFVNYEEDSRSMFDILREERAIAHLRGNPDNLDAAISCLEWYLENFVDTEMVIPLGPLALLLCKEEEVALLRWYLAALK
ncbi:MAG: hypothetical protein ACI360_00130 [Atopobiaceae bacterium]|jgi:hypothetical protein